MHLPVSALPGRMFARAQRALLCLTCLALLLTGCSGPDGTERFSPLAPGTVVLVVGDSLVAGTGAPRGNGWPEALARLTGWQVINGGVPGDTSANALRRLDGLIAEYQPEAILIAVGGNDFLRNIPPDITRDNIAEMIGTSRAVTDHVGIVAIPAKSMGAALIGSLSDHGLFDALAREHDVALIPAVVAAVLSRDDLRADRIHANERGYIEMAEGIHKALAGSGWIEH